MSNGSKGIDESHVSGSMFSASVDRETDKDKQWHQRHGYPSFNTIFEVMSLYGMSYKGMYKLFFYTECQLKKAHKFPFTFVHTSRVGSFFELLFMGL